MRVLFLPKYGPRGASSRLRFYQYIPYLESKGIECVVSPLFDDEYLAQRNKKGVGKGAAKAAGMQKLLRAFVHRWKAISEAKQYDLLFTHCESYPYLPPVLENHLKAQRIPYVADYDDAIFHNYDKNKRKIVRTLLGTKIADYLKGAATVIAGSPYLYDYAKRVNDKVRQIPTVVDLERYPLDTPVTRTDPRFRAGWIGSFSTAPYLDEITAPLSAFCKERNACLVMIGAGKYPVPVEPQERLEWAENTEVSDCRSFDVGLMPLPDTPWTRGKCGYKLIQYMACGLPVIAAPVGVNTEIVTQDENGFLASTAEEWKAALERLQGDPALARRMGVAGRKRVEERYCLAATAPQVEQTLRDCAKSR